MGTLQSAWLIAVVAPVSFAPPTQPSARAHVDQAHGVLIPDEYRWMEKAGASLDPWIDAEDSNARRTLDALPGRKALETRVAELWRTGMGTVDETLLDERSGRRLLFEYSLVPGRMA